MRRETEWTATKFVLENDQLMASRDPACVSPTSRLIADRIAAAYQGLLAQHVAGKLLDLGCGNAPLYGVYQPHAEEVICIDWPQTLHEASFIDAACDLNEGIPLATESFDTILASDVLEHIAQPDILFSDIVRVLRPQGKLILGVPFMYWLHEEPYDFHRYTEHKLRHFCDQHGLSVLSLEPYGGFREICMDLIGKNLRVGWKAKLCKSVLDGIFNLGAMKRMSNSTMRQFPLGYSLVAQKKV